MPSILGEFHFEIQEPLAWGNPLWLLLSLTAKNQNMHFFQVLWLWSQQPVGYTLSGHACPPKHVTWTLVQSSIVKHILLFIYNNQVWLSISTPWRRQKELFIRWPYALILSWNICRKQFRNLEKSMNCNEMRSWVWLEDGHEWNGRCMDGRLKGMSEELKEAQALIRKPQRVIQVLLSYVLLIHRDT